MSYPSVTRLAAATVVASIATVVEASETLDPTTTGDDRAQLRLSSQLVPLGSPPSIPTGIVISTRASFTIDTTGSLLDTELGLFDASGFLMADNDDIDGDAIPQSRLSLNALTPGRYFASISGHNTFFDDGFGVDVTEDSSAGAWRFSLGGIPLLEGEVGPAEAAFVDFLVRDPGPTTDTLQDVGELQRFVVETTDTIGLNTSIAVFSNASGELMGSDDASGQNGASRLELRVPAGAYTVAVSATGAEYDDGFTVLASDAAPGGIYRLRVGPLGEHPLTLLGAGGDTDFYEFTVEPVTNLGEVAESVQPYQIDTFGLDNMRDTHIALWTEAGDLIDQNDDAFGENFLNSVLLYPDGLPSGAYVLGVGSYGVEYADDFVARVDGQEESGSYRLNYQSTPQAPRSRLGVHQFRGDVDFFRFTIGEPNDLGAIGLAGEPIEINTFGSNFNTQIAVFNELGGLIETNDDAPSVGTNRSLIERSFPRGIYYLYVGGCCAELSEGFVTTVDGLEARGAIAGLAGETPFSGATSSTDLYDFFRFEIEADGCGQADLAEPFGALDIADVITFLQRFGAGDTAVDFASPSGILDIADVVAFLQLFGAGCPS